MVIETRKEWVREALFSVCLIVPACILYWQGLGFDFVEIDDGGQVVDNVYVQSLSWGNIYHIFTNPVVGMYQPLTSLMNVFLVSLFGLQAPALHIYSLCLHLVNTILVYLIARNLFENRTKAVFVSLIFSCHPLCVESVVWVSALSTLAFSFFYLSALLFYLRYVQTHKLSTYGWVALFFFLGELCKVQMTPFVAVLFLVDYLKARPIAIKASIIEKFPLIVIALSFIGVALYFRGNESSFPGFDYSPTVLVPAQIAWYFIKLWMPVNLSVIYDWPPEPWTESIIFGYVIFALLLFGLYLFRSNRLVVFGVMFYLVNIILHTALFTQYLGPYADRYAYLSCLGLLIAMVGLVPVAVIERVQFVLLGIVLILGLLTRAQVAVWEDTISVWSNSLLHQRATFSNGMRGALYYQQGELELALADFEKFDQNPDTRLEPEKYAYLYNALGIMSVEQDKKKALEYFLKVLQFTQEPGAYMNVARILQLLGDSEQEEAIFRRILALYPSNRVALDGLSNLYLRIGKYQPVVGLLDRLIALEPLSAQTYKKRAFVHLLLGNKALATADIQAVAGLLTPAQAVKDIQFQQLMTMLQEQ